MMIRSLIVKLFKLCNINAAKDIQLMRSNYVETRLKPAILLSDYLSREVINGTVKGGGSALLHRLGYRSCTMLNCLAHRIRRSVADNVAFTRKVPHLAPSQSCKRVCSSGAGRDRAGGLFQSPIFLHQK